MTNHHEKPNKGELNTGADYNPDNVSIINVAELRARLGAKEQAAWAEMSKQQRQAGRAKAGRPDEFPVAKNDFRDIAQGAPRIARQEQPVHVEENPTQPDIPVSKGISPERLAELKAAPRYTAEGFDANNTDEINIAEYTQSEEFHIPELKSEEPAAVETPEQKAELSQADKAGLTAKRVKVRMAYAERMLKGYNGGQNEALNHVLTVIDGIKAKLARGSVDIGRELQSQQTLEAARHAIHAENNKHESLASVLSELYEASEDEGIGETDRNMFRSLHGELHDAFAASSDWAKLDETLRAINTANQYGKKDTEDGRIRAAVTRHFEDASRVIRDIQANRKVKEDDIVKLFESTEDKLVQIM